MVRIYNQDIAYTEADQLLSNTTPRSSTPDHGHTCGFDAQLGLLTKCENLSNKRKF